MFELSLHDTASPALMAMPERFRAALTAKAGALAAEMQGRIQQNLSGGVLNEKSGTLAESVGIRMVEASTGVAAYLFTSPDVKYAAIHEFGGTVPPHEIVPDKTKVLAFLIGGKQAFAARVLMPAVTMPERSYMRSSLEQMADLVRGEFTAAVNEAAR